MTSADLLADAFDRVSDVVHGSVSGLTRDQLAHRVDADSNPVGWLVWHLSRVQDDHVAGAAGFAQVWHRDGWADRSGLPFGADTIGYGQSSSDVAKVRLDADFLLGYYDAVHAQTIRYVRSLTDADLDHVVDERWDPPVTLAVRLVSVISDDLQHAGQAAFVRGLLDRGASD